MSERYRDVSPAQAKALIDEENATVLDVRSAPEFDEIGHIPRAILLPLDWIVTACAALPRDGRPIVVCCEHGIRSVHACGRLAAAGIANLHNMTGGMSCWSAPREFGPGSPFGPYGPSSWLIENGHLVPREGKALDVACGRGRHAILLAAVGLDVRAIDRDAESLESLARAADGLGYRMETEQLDLETGPFPGGRERCDLGRELYDLVIVVHYLHRALFPALIDGLRPGGLLLYETFTVDQAKRGRPSNPDFLLEPGELLRRVEPLEVVAQREGEFDERSVASVAARKCS